MSDEKKCDHKCKHSAWSTMWKMIPAILFWLTIGSCVIIRETQVPTPRINAIEARLDKLERR